MAASTYLQPVRTPISNKISDQVVGEKYLNQRDWERLLLGSVMLPVQYYDQLRRPHILEGERKLMFAVLEEGIREYLENGSPRTFHEFQQRRELDDWFAASDQSGVFTFENLCETFGINSRGLWKALQAQRCLQHQQEQRRLPSYRRPFASNPRKAG